MNAENFSYYLLDTSKLKEIGYSDLQSLITAYPYCQNLHFLICKKSQLEQHPDFNTWLQTAATYSTDRAYLYQLLMEVDFEKDYTFETVDLNELTNEKESKTLPVLEPEAIINEPQEDALISPTLVALQTQQTLSLSDTTLEDDEDEPLVTFDDLLGGADENEIAKSEQNQEIIVETLDIPQDKPEEINLVITPFMGESKKNEPLPKSAFSSYKEKTEKKGLEDLPFSNVEEMAEHRRRIEENLATEHEKRKKKEEKKKKTQDLIAYAEESLKENEETASETLAKILALQGHKNKAITMYEKLKLQIPEKSAFFAAEIDKLNTKQD